MVSWLHSRDIMRALTENSSCLITYIVTVIALVSFRLFYFGYPFPNTYYAKVSTDYQYNIDVGLKYLNSLLLSNNLIRASLWTILVDVLLCGTLHIFKKIKLNTYFILFGLLSFLTLGLYFLIPVVTGGDHFAQWRFYQPLYPIIILPFCVLVSLFFERVDRLEYLAWPVVLLFVFLTNSFAPLRWDKLPGYTPIIREFNIIQTSKEAYLLANQAFQDLTEKPAVGEYVVGAAQLYYDGPIIDLMGLNNLMFGHSEGDRKGVKNHAAFSKAVFYQILPEVVIPRAVDHPTAPQGLLECDSSFIETVLQGIICEDAFRQKYLPVVFEIEQPEVKYLFAFVRSDFIDAVHGVKYTILSSGNPQ